MTKFEKYNQRVLSVARDAKRNEKYDKLKSACWVSSDKACDMFLKLVDELPKEIGDQFSVEIENILYEIAKIKVASE